MFGYEKYYNMFKCSITVVINVVFSIVLCCYLKMWWFFYNYRKQRLYNYIQQCVQIWLNSNQFQYCKQRPLPHNTTGHQQHIVYTL